MEQDSCQRLFERMQTKLSSSFPQFLRLLRHTADPTDASQIFFDDFLYLLKRFDLTLTQYEQEKLLNAFPGRDEGLRKRINVAKIYECNLQRDIQRAYQGVNYDCDGDDDPIDQSGYTGIFYRPE